MRWLVVLLLHARAAWVASARMDASVNITVFHVHQASFSGPAPINMDVGDAAGDLFFSLRRSVSICVDCSCVLDSGSEISRLDMLCACLNLLNTRDGLLCSASLALECAGVPPYYTNDCTNPEVDSKDLVVTKLVLEVIGGGFGAYAHCNVCTNGTE